MRLGWYDLFLGILESRASFSMYVLTSFPLGSSVEEHVKSTELNEEEHPSSSTPGELSLPQRSLWSQGTPTSCRTDVEGTSTHPTQLDAAILSPPAITGCNPL